MSKIGKMKIPVPAGVNLEINPNNIKVTGTKGSVDIKLPDGVSVERENDLLSVKISSNSLNDKQGLFRTLIANAIHGVVNTWSKKLEIVGTGFKAKMEGKTLLLDIGFSHTVKFEAPENVNISLESPTLIVVTGVNKEKVGQIADEIRRIKKPDPYKGKGIRYEGEKIKLKPGKKAKTTTA